MANAIQKVALSASRDIPFNKLLLSSCNVRHVKAGVSIQELANDIARRSLLQSLTVRPVLDPEGNETDRFEIPAGGRRYRALELLVKQKRLARTAPVPCVVRTEGIAEEDSLAENVQRAPLHPLDQFRAFLALREKGQSEEEIAAAFFVPVAVVRQRLRLASVSPKLLELYAEDVMTLNQLMAFTISADWERQEQVWERLASAYGKEPHLIRRMLTEGAVRASDKRARFIGFEAYDQAGGVIMRDLFQGDDGGWLKDVALVERLVAERLEREAEVVRAEGWRWIEVAPDFPYGHTFGLRRLRGEEVPFSAEEDAERDALQAEYNELGEKYANKELPDEDQRRLAEIEERLSALDERPVRFDPDEIARGGAFVSIDGDGSLVVERGFVRPEDELPIEPIATGETGDEGEGDGPEPVAMPMRIETEGAPLHAGSDPAPEPEEDEGIKPLPDRLLAELTTTRTVALQHALGERPDVAFLAALHALCLKLFYPYPFDTCLELDLRQVAFGAQAPGLSDSTDAKAIGVRHEVWAASLPREAADLWAALSAMDGGTRQRLFAHCAACTVNAVHEAWHRRPRALAHADLLADAVQLDMAQAGWAASVDNYLGRVTKSRILQAVREARGADAAERIAQLRKAEMAGEAEQMLAGTGWLPEPLRTPNQGDSTRSNGSAEGQPDQEPGQEPVGSEAQEVDPATACKIEAE